jgi:hypothetical protein
MLFANPAKDVRIEAPFAESNSTSKLGKEGNGFLAQKGFAPGSPS